MITTRTPLRISFFGGGTDYPIWYREFGGSVLSTAIDKCCYITCRRLPPFFEYHSRVSYSRIENVNQNGAIEHPSVRACLKYLGVDEGLRFTTLPTCPLGLAWAPVRRLPSGCCLAFTRFATRCATSMRWLPMPFMSSRK